MTRFRALIGGALTAALLGLGVPLATPAAADHTALCDGYVGCAERGYSHFGYRTEGQRMWWRMYAGHNCTNYVAYRMVKGGMSPERPWEGSGNGYNWGHALARMTDDTPMVGAVAWWDKYQGYSGSNGHVAYVEKVVSPREIIVSEDFWGGDFHWRRITKGGTGWPTGFIHLNDAAVEVVEKPRISGDVAVGKTLTATTGAFTPQAKRSLQWYSAGKPIPGATRPTFTPTPAQRKTRLTVVVRASRRGYVEGAASSARSPKVQPGTLDQVAAPVVSGTARVEEVLTTSLGEVSPAPDSTSVQWYADGQPVEGATGTRLRLTPALVERRVTAVVTATREGYRDRLLTTTATERVAPGRFEVRAPWGLDGRARRGRELLVTPGRVHVDDATTTYTWLRDGEPVTEPLSGRQALSYRQGVDDVGHVLSVRVEVARRGYETYVEELSTGSVTTTRSRTTATAVAKVVDKGTKKKPDRQRRVVVDATVTAPGVERHAGTVSVALDGREVQGALREDGTVRLVLRDVAPGEHVVSVSYAGTEVASRSRTTVTVVVPRR